MTTLVEYFIYGSAFIIFAVLLISLNRKRILWHDSILNPHQDPYLEFAEKERQLGKSFFQPWITSDPTLLTILKNSFPNISLPSLDELTKPNMQPVKFEATWGQTPQGSDPITADVICVGGPPAAMLAYEEAKNGKRVLYVHNNNVTKNNKKTRPIWFGAANHGEPDVLTEAPAYITGNHPLKFFWNELKRFIFPLRYDHGVLKDEFPWLTLNINEWIKHPIQLITSGLSVAIDTHKLATKNKKSPTRNVDRYQELCTRAKTSGDYLEKYNTDNKILRKPRGCLIVAPDQATWNLLQVDVERLKKDNILKLITSEEAKQKYGIPIRNAVGLLEKTHDFIFETDFFQTICNSIKKLGGDIITNWQLERILINADNNEPCLEFSENVNNHEKKYHYRKCATAYLSLGSTIFKPKQYDLVSVTGVSINALLIGVKLTGGPIVCGGVSNHVVFTPLTEPTTIEIMNPITQQKEFKDITLIRIAVGGAVGPLNRSEKNWYTYYGPSAINALHCVRKTLPENAELKVLSVIGCNRVIGKDGRQVTITPKIKINGQLRSLNNITIQVGAGGGGLTQMGALPMLLTQETIIS